MHVLSWTFSDTFEEVYAELQDRSPWPIQFRLDPDLEMEAAIAVPRPDRKAESVPVRMHPRLSQPTAEIIALHELGHLHLVLLGYPGVWQRRTGEVARGLSKNLTNLIHHPLIRSWAEDHHPDYIRHLGTLATIRKDSIRPQLRLFVRPKYPAKYAVNLFAYAGEYLEYYPFERSEVTFPYKLPKRFRRDVDALVKRVDETKIEDPKCARQLLRDLTEEYKIGRYVIVLSYELPTLDNARGNARTRAPRAPGSY